MDLDLYRFNDGGDSTLGLLFIDGEWECYTLEDEHRDIKVMHETRIPAGRREIKLRTDMSSKMNQRYQERYSWFVGHLWLQDVPNFMWIYVHEGVTDDHTSGCILVGDQVNNNNAKAGRLSDSALAYERVYLRIVAALQAGHQVFIIVHDEADTFGREAAHG